MGHNRGPGEPAHHPGGVFTPPGPGAELETHGAPQPENRVFWHHLGVTSRG